MKPSLFCYIRTKFKHIYLDVLFMMSNSCQEILLKIPLSGIEPSGKGSLPFGSKSTQEEG